MIVNTVDESSGLSTHGLIRSALKTTEEQVREGWEYLSSLRVLKTTFVEGSEGDAVLDAIRTSFEPGVLSFLDVGCADGLFTRRAKDLLNLAGTNLSITAIDPLSAAALSTARQIPHDVVYRTRFEDFSTEAKFDVINVRHSLYYLRDPMSQVARMTDLLKPGGLLAFTLWGRDCDLYRVYLATRSELANGVSYAMTSEDLEAALKRNSSLRDIGCRLSTGKINLSAWRGSEDVLRSIYIVLRRQLNLPVSDGAFALFRTSFQHLMLTGQRTFAVITCRKVA